MHLSHSDFCRMTLEQFEAVSRAWNEHEEARHRDRWERTRSLATTMLQPHSKKALRPTDVLRLPWDKKAEKDAKAERLTQEERKRRAEEALRKWG